MVVQVAEIIDVQQLGGQEVLNVYHFLDSTGTASLSGLVTDMKGSVIPAIADVQGSGLTHTSIRSRLVWPTDTLTVTTDITPPISGFEATTDELASCVALSVAWALGATTVLAGGFTGHLKRGGARIAGPTEAMVVANAVTAGIATNWATAFTELLQPGGDAWFLVVASFLNGARVRQTLCQSYAAITGSSAPSPSTQNTRKVLRGRTR